MKQTEKALVLAELTLLAEQESLQNCLRKQKGETISMSYKRRLTAYSPATPPRYISRDMRNMLKKKKKKKRDTDKIAVSSFIYKRLVKLWYIHTYNGMCCKH